MALDDGTRANRRLGNIMKLSDILEHDNRYILEKYMDFSQELTISTNSTNERTIIGSLQSDCVTFNSSMSSSLNAYSTKLFMPEQSDLKLSKGQIVYVNSNAYRIVDSTLNMDIRELSLEKR